MRSGWRAIPKRSTRVGTWLAAALIGGFIAGLLGFAVKGAGPNVGQHLHVEIADYPLDGHPIPRAPHAFNVTFREHDQTGATAWLRVDDYSTTRPISLNGGAPTTKAKLVLGPCVDCSVTAAVTIDFSTWSVGRHELRWHLDLPHNADGNRQFTTSRDQVCVGSCSPNVSGRTTPFAGAGSWYLDDYATVYDLSADSEHRPSGHVKVRAAQDARTVCAFLNPDFHHGSSGTRLGCWADTSTHTVTIPTTAVPGDRLVLLATQANGNAGVYVRALGDGSNRATANVQFQSWWAKGGVVVP